MRLISSIVLILALFPVCHAQKFRFSPLAETVIQQREEHAPANRQNRAARIRQLFVEAGCGRDRLSEQPLENMAGTNVICRLPGKSKESIIVGANYSPEVLDNWTGACLLPSLYQSLVNRKRHHTFIFIAFADGNRDLAGSQFFAGQMNQADVDRTEAMINLDALGLSPTKISSSVSDKKLVESFFTVVYALKQMGSQVDLSKAVAVDSEPFALRHIPQITIHSLTQDAVAGLQIPEQPLVSAGDPEFAHVDPGFRSSFYYNSYHLISGYLAYLDETLKPKHK
jgi:hypothetical protein